MLKKLLTAWPPRTAPSNAAECHFIEHGSAKEFKRCVLAHVEDCRPKQMVFMGTFTSGVHYNTGDVVCTPNGAVMVVTLEGPTEILTPPRETSFAFTGTYTGGWPDQWVQEGPAVSSRTAESRHRGQAPYEFKVDFREAPSVVPP